MKNVAFISGTSKGIGKSIAKLLLSENYIVYGFSRSNTINNENFTFVKTDFSDAKKIEHFDFPKIEEVDKILLINNAATIGEIIPLGKRNNTRICEEILYGTEICIVFRIHMKTLLLVFSMSMN